MERGREGGEMRKGKEARKMKSEKRVNFGEREILFSEGKRKERMITL